MTREERIFWNLAVVAWSDGVLVERERTLLHEYQVWLGIPPERADEMIELARGEPVPEKMARPASEEEREETIRTIVEMALADHRLDYEERRLLERFLHRLGVDESELQARIDRYWHEMAPTVRKPEWTSVDTFRLLAVAAVVDGHLDADEMALLLEKARNLNLGEDEAARIVKEVLTSGKARLLLPADEDELLRVLVQVGEVVAADGKLARKERQLLQKLQRKSGLPDEVFDRCIPPDLERDSRE